MRQIHFNNNWYRYWIIIAWIVLTWEATAQSIRRQCISSYGSSANTENVFISQTAGQSFHTAVSFGELTVSQGFQQPTGFSLKEIDNPLFKSLNVKIYPNPASHSITITCEKEMEQAFIRVSDISGKYIFAEKIPNLLSHTMNCSSWTSGVYLITLFDDRQNSKTLKLIISK